MLKPLLILLILALLTVVRNNAQAALSIPSGMTTADRQEALKILGFGANYKILGDPYPLGGYYGFEVGVSYEVIPSSSIAKLGNGAAESDDVSYASITLGKGLFYDVDLFLHFAPLGQGEKFSSFGGALRWGIVELPNLPIHFSLQASASSASFQNKINTTNQSFDLIGGWNLQELIFYGGVGLIRTSGIFIGGANGITDTGETLTEAVNEPHTFVGVSVKYGEYFGAFQLDRASQAAYGLKLGARF